MAEDWDELVRLVNQTYSDTKGAIIPSKIFLEEYLSLDDSERVEVDALMLEWLLSDESDKWFAALNLVRKTGMVSAIPTLRELQARMEVSTDPEYFNFWRTVNRLLGQLSELASTEPDAGVGE